MYEFVVSFTVPADRRDDFIRIATTSGRDSIANEPGSKKFDLLVDEENPNLFYLHEGYADQAAFNAHVEGPYFQAFFSQASTYAEGPVWLMKASLVEA